jgi:hypothetical protein
LTGERGESRALDVLASPQGLAAPGEGVDGAGGSGERGDELVEDRAPALRETCEVDVRGARRGRHADLP